MKNYVVRALFNFNDTAEKTEAGTDTPRKIGNVWNCTKERYEFLLEHKAVELVGIDEIKEPKVEYTQVEAPKEAKEVKKPRVATIKNKKLTNKK